MDETVVYQQWVELISRYSAEIVRKYDTEDEVELVLDHEAINDSMLIEMMTEDPEKTLSIGEDAVRSLKEPDQKDKAVSIRIKNLPSIYERNLRDIGVGDLKKLRYSEILVAQRKAKTGKINVAMFECTSCGFHVQVSQPRFNFSEPLECPKDKGGCGKKAGSATFKFLPERSEIKDLQWAYVQEDYHRARIGRPERMPILLEGPALVGRLEVGQKVRITYWPDLKQNAKDKNDFQWILKILHVEPVVKEENEDLTVSDVKYFESIKDKILELGTRSIAPQIFGYDIIKLSLFLQFIGAPAQMRNCGIEERGEFHILLFGPGGTGKSQLLEDMMSVWPEAYFSGAKNVTSAGLTAAVVKDDLMGGWVLEAGVLILADGTLAGIDELDKATEQERGSLHMVMEQRKVSINKAGINAEIPTKPIILACANPRNEFIEEASIQEQSELGRTLLQRFALKWKLGYVSDQKVIRARARHSLLSKDPTEPVGKRSLDIRTLRKYRAFVSHIDPVFDRSMVDYLTECYVDITNKAANWRNVDEITQRVMEDLDRLARASARARQQRTVEKFDVDVATMLVSRSLTTVYNGMDDRIPEWDYDENVPKWITVEELSSLIQTVDPDRAGVPVDDLRSMAADRGWMGMDNLLNIMFEQGRIFYPRTGKVSLI